MGVLFKRDSQGIGQLLKSAGFAAAVHAKAEAVDGEVRRNYSEVDSVVDDYVTDRAASSVTLKRADGDPGKLVEVRDGALTKAAARSGLDVHRKA